MNDQNSTLLSLPSRQNGAALIIGLVLMVSLTIIGIGALNTTSLEQRMAGNMTELNLALNAAESAARAIAINVAENVGGAEAICFKIGPDCQYQNNNKNISWWNDADKSWWEANSIDLTNNLLSGDRAVTGVKHQPQAVIEVDSFIPDRPGKGFSYSQPGKLYYRVTTRGVGSTDKTEVIIQQIIAKRLN